MLQAGERRELHAVSLADGEGDPSPLLEAWAAELGRRGARADGGALPGGVVLLVPLLPRRHRGRPARRTWRWRPTGPSTCSSSTTASSPPSATGSTTNDKFPSDARRARRGRSPPRAARPGIWIAPVPRRRRLGGRGGAPRVARHAPRQRARRSSAWSTTRWGGAGAHARHHPARGARPPRGASPASLVDAGYPVPQARLHLRAVDPGRLRRPGPHARPAGARRLRRRSGAGAGDDAFLLGLRRAARARRRGRRRHAHRRRRGALVAPAAGPVPATRATPAASRRR